MKNRILTLIFLVTILIPQVVFASWWNPFSWNIFKKTTPIIEKIQVATSTTPDSNTEIEKLRAEIEELKNQKTERTKKVTPTTQTTKQNTIPSATTNTVPQTKPAIINRDTLYTDLLQKYTNFQSITTKEISQIDKISPLSSEKIYSVYLNTLIKSINADLGYLISLKSQNQRPAIEDIYLSKFNKLKSEYDVENRRYLIEKKEDELNSAILQEQAEKEAYEKTIADKAKYVQDIKIKIAEMDQLDTQIETLTGPSFIDILNNAKKLDGKPLFYTVTSYATFTFPYDRNSGIDEDPLQAIVANYRAFLVVELMKNQ
ncbi:MAG: hypothetical protein AAB392_02010 [Patescibacteria group bacterium]